MNNSLTVPGPHKKVQVLIASIGNLKRESSVAWRPSCHHVWRNAGPRGGHSHWKGVWGCAAVMTPFFQASCRSLAHQFTLNAPLLCPLFSIFRKFLHFQPCFGQNSSSLDPNFSKFSFPRPPFFQENPLPRPYILKPAWHTPTKKKVECPPRALD